jgi:hypothetical protein
MATSTPETAEAGERIEMTDEQKSALQAAILYRCDFLEDWAERGYAKEVRDGAAEELRNLKGAAHAIGLQLDEPSRYTVAK